MIALLILGFGLLVVAAALPVGLTYTRGTIEEQTGAAAAEYALDLIEQRVRRVLDPWDETAPPAMRLRCRADFFEPRWDTYVVPPPPVPQEGYSPGAPAEDLSEGQDARRPWEPRIKVRPLLARPISATAGATFGQELDAPYQDVEQRIAMWLMTTWWDSVNKPHRECDYLGWMPEGVSWASWNLPSICAAYPPIGSEGSSDVAGFFDRPYAWRPVSDFQRRQALERRVAWVAFYRRVSYREGSDPALYEVVAVATRIPERGYRFPRFNPAAQIAPGFDVAGGARAQYTGYDTLAPIPWLVVFSELPAPPAPAYGQYGTPSNPDNIPDPDWPAPSTLVFYAGRTDGELLPPGSIFIPAVNDDRPTILNQLVVPGSFPVRHAGFVPHAPEVLPVYEVVGRELQGNRYRITVRNNGFYPWVNAAAGRTATDWPVWVIPPAFKEVSGGQPVFENRSPVLAVSRRIIRFAEVP